MSLSATARELSLGGLLELDWQGRRCACLSALHGNVYLSPHLASAGSQEHNVQNPIGLIREYSQQLDADGPHAQIKPRDISCKS
jgi:hypothetical protein